MIETFCDYSIVEIQELLQVVMRFGNLIKCQCALIMLLHHKLNKISHCSLFTKDLLAFRGKKKRYLIRKNALEPCMVICFLRYFIIFILRATKKYCRMDNKKDRVSHIYTVLIFVKISFISYM